MTAGHDAPEEVLRLQVRGASIETSFERLLGRQATDVERARLHRVRDALGLRDNDAFWSIVMALEQYDALFRAYPAQLAEATEHALEKVRAACTAAAQEEVAAVQRALAEKVAETSVRLARKLADRPFAVHRVTAALATVVAFGSLCVHAGYALAVAGQPFWMRPAGDGSTSARLLTSVLSVPAGWMIFALLLPAAVRGIAVGWQLAVEPLGEQRDRAAGWCLVLGCVLGVGACAVLLARIG